MNPYLTKKSTERPQREIVILAVMTLLTGSAISVTLKDLMTEPEDLGIDLIMTALFAWSVLSTIFRMVRRNLAKRVANRLVNTYDSVLPFDTLGSVVGIKNAQKVLIRLADTGYLQNMGIDHEHRCIVLMAENDRKEIFVSVQCPNCGAKNNVVKGRHSKCKFCDQVLPG